jgi:hypothetical protein
VNFGLFPELIGAPRGRDRKKALSARALGDLQLWLEASLPRRHGDHGEEPAPRTATSG